MLLHIVSSYSLNSRVISLIYWIEIPGKLNNCFICRRSLSAWLPTATDSKCSGHRNTAAFCSASPYYAVAVSGLVKIVNNL